MLKIRFCIIAVFFLFFSLNLEAATAAHKLHSLLDFNSFQADFDTTMAGEQSIDSKQSGRFYLMKPSLLRWEIKQPNHQIILMNNRMMTIYDSDLMQLTRQSVSGIFNPSVLLNDFDVLQRDFTVEQVQLSGLNYAFKLVPKVNKKFKYVILGFDKKNKLSFILIKNDLDQENVFHFSGIKINQNINPGVFKLRLPPGVDVVDSGQVP